MRRGMAAFLTLAAAACAAEVVFVVPGTDVISQDSTPNDTTDNGGGGGLQRVGLVVVVALAAEDAAVGPAVGAGANGRLVGVDVRVTRVGTVGEHVGTTDSAGQVTFTGLLPGDFEASALRVLTAEERAALGPDFADVTALAGGGRTQVARGTGGLVVEAVAGRPGSLVISEVFPAWIQVGDNSYVYATYLEVYNNTDTTIYLDGMLVGRALGAVFDFPNSPCSVTQAWQADPDGLWTRDVLRLPGSGQEYPLLAGTAAVIATDAIDHSAVDPQLPNLATADFESIGAADVDNPAVPNATILMAAQLTFFGRGIMFRGPIFFVARPTSLDSLPKGRLYDDDFVRIPRPAILDVLATIYSEANQAALGYVLCPVFIHPAFDRQFVRASGVAAEMYSIVRRQGTVVNGRTVLQRTRTSARDFLRVDFPTPATVP